ncbi:MAG: cytidylate kinase-like family protein [Bacteroidales bacterium]|nr:cytidylate kinase-like family protein [Bacteroidales bacterium]
MEQNYVITIGRSIGAGGLGTAKALAAELGIRMYDKNLLLEVARQSGLSPEIFEKKDEKASRSKLTSLFGFRSLLQGNGSITTDTIMNEESLFKIQSQVIRDLAEKESCIIVGRCADYILRDNPRCVSIFINASPELRVKRLVKDGMEPDEARKRIETGDRKRAEYYNYYTFKKWGDSASYDLCIDAGKLGDEGTLKVILDYLKIRKII